MKSKAGHCLGALENALVEIYNFLIGCPPPNKRKHPGVLALSKTKHTGTGLKIAPQFYSTVFENRLLTPYRVIGSREKSIEIILVIGGS